jgi:hypothetical protein
MSKLYFENSYGQRRLIGEPQNDNEAYKMISDFCKERNFKIYYTRMWSTPNGEKWYDVGSHTEFFIEVNEDNES